MGSAPTTQPTPVKIISAQPHEVTGNDTQLISEGTAIVLEIFCQVAVFHVIHCILAIGAATVSFVQRRERIVRELFKEMFFL